MFFVSLTRAKLLDYINWFQVLRAYCTHGNLSLKSLVCLKISTDIYCALLFQVDEMNVEILTMIPTVEATAPSTFESYRYPRAGELNSFSV